MDRGIRYARAERFGPPVMEPLRPERLSAPAPQSGIEGSEDCLHLTVWSPEGAVAAPVLVWIHGGAHVGGGAADPVTDGARLASTQGLVVVAVQYRLGALGHLLFDEESPDAANAALHDQLAALQWVSDNIGVYGGDRTAVTVMGQSAGGVDVLALLSTAPERSLFHRAIAHSCTGERVTTPGQAREVRDQLTRSAGVSSADGLLELGVAELIVAQTRVIAERSASAPIDSLPFRPVIDGRLLSQSPLDAFATGVATSIPLLIGANRREALPWMTGAVDDAKALDELLRTVAPAAAATDLASAYGRDHGRVPTPRELREAVLSELMYRSPVQRLVDARGNAPTYAYVFDPDGLDDVDPGHSGELPLVFGTMLDASPGAATLSERLMNAWGSFAREGRPASEPAWLDATAGVFSWGRHPRLLPEVDVHLRAALTAAGAVCDRL
ncbi:carboxylesterase family protein [Microbacterium sp. P26]|uniref:carboxylesterase family protein n=1 Tax=Microbacterium TaxID=33882 RepID=UPI00203DE0BA|nr:carboxylesterase family protein [Microbacterium sp. P26]MCM3502327.1 carboxylesterase family protein [Microbacterium sp. P26]